MRTTIHCHFDGKVLVPDGPVDLPVDQPLTLRVVGDVVLVPAKTGNATGAEIAASEAVGMWADRTDITDSTAFARELRRAAEQRGGGL